jgi:hypothetical protein
MNLFSSPILIPHDGRLFFERFVGCPQPHSQSFIGFSPPGSVRVEEMRKELQANSESGLGQRLVHPNHAAKDYSAPPVLFIPLLLQHIKSSSNAVEVCCVITTSNMPVVAAMKHVQFLPTVVATSALGTGDKF